MKKKNIKRKHIGWKQKDIWNNSSYVENTNSHKEWAPFIWELANLTIVDQREKNGKSAQGQSPLIMNEDIDISKVGESDMPF